MEPYVAALIGVTAAAASLYSAHGKTMVPLRVAAIVGNILAMAYSFMLGTYFIFMLNAALLALHGWRLRAMLNLIRDIDVATGSDMNVDRLLPYTRTKHFKADDIMMERGEYATAAFYIVSGEVEIIEIKETFGKGTPLGEIGLFTPDGRRIMTVRCKTDVQTAIIDYDQFYELYFQNPQYGYQLLHLGVGRLQRSGELLRLSAITR